MTTKFWKLKVQKQHWDENVVSNRRSVDHPSVKSFFLDKAEKLNELVLGKKIESILDCGCGNGFFQFYLSKVFGIDTVGVDFSLSMLKISKSQQRVCASVLALPFKDNSYDLVTCHGMMHHIPDDDRTQVVMEMKRVSKKYVFIGEPNISHPLVRLLSYFSLEERMALSLSKKRLKNIAGQCDLKALSFFKRGVVMPNKTPLFMLPLLNVLEKRITFLGHCIYYLLETTDK